MKFRQCDQIQCEPTCLRTRRSRQLLHADLAVAIGAGHRVGAAVGRQRHRGARAAHVVDARGVAEIVARRTGDGHWHRVR